MQSNNTNTILLVVIIALVVGFGVWYLTTHKKPAETEQPGLHIDVNVPGGGDKTTQ